MVAAVAVVVVAVAAAVGIVVAAVASGEAGVPEVQRAGPALDPLVHQHASAVGEVASDQHPGHTLPEGGHHIRVGQAGPGQADIRVEPAEVVHIQQADDHQAGHVEEGAVVGQAVAVEEGAAQGEVAVVEEAHGLGAEPNSSLQSGLGRGGTQGPGVHQARRSRQESEPEEADAFLRL